MAYTFNVDGIEYKDKLPHSRVEKILYDILEEEGGGVDPSDIATDEEVKKVIDDIWD